MKDNTVYFIHIVYFYITKIDSIYLKDVVPCIRIGILIPLKNQKYHIINS